MGDEAVLTILKTNSTDQIPGLQENLVELEKLTEVRIKFEYIPSVVGQSLAGEAIKIILSDPIQALKNAAEIGLMIWGILKAVQAVGKKIHLTKKMAAPLLISKVKQDVISEKLYENDLLEKAKIWGPMEIDSIEGPIFKFTSSEIEALVPFALMMAVILPIPGGRSRTYWNILKADGEILGSWTTQTLTERLPDFLKPL